MSSSSVLVRDAGNDLKDSQLFEFGSQIQAAGNTGDRRMKGPVVANSALATPAPPSRWATAAPNVVRYAFG